MEPVVGIYTLTQEIQGRSRIFLDSGTWREMHQTFLTGERNGNDDDMRLSTSNSNATRSGASPQQGFRHLPRRFSGGGAALYGTYIDEPLAMYRPGQADLYYHANGLYNVAALTDNTGAAVERYKYEAFGKATITDGSGATVLPQGGGWPGTIPKTYWLGHPFRGCHVHEVACSAPDAR